MQIIIKFISKVWNWVFSIPKEEREKKNTLEKLQLSIRVTAKCRYNAATRLQAQGQFSFFTTTFLSLGLIFVPLMKTSGVSLAFNSSVLNMMQIFLAVAVLVFSVVIATARYDVRAEKLTECGDRLKDLNRSIDKEKSQQNSQNSQNSQNIDHITKVQEKYSDIVTDSENHKRVDYKLSVLEMGHDYVFTGLPRLKLLAISLCARLVPYLVPCLLIIIEAIFITDMVGFTEILTPYLNGNAVGITTIN